MHRVLSEAYDEFELEERETAAEVPVSVYVERNPKDVKEETVMKETIQENTTEEENESTTITPRPAPAGSITITPRPAPAESVTIAASKQQQHQQHQQHQQQQQHKKYHYQQHQKLSKSHPEDDAAGGAHDGCPSSEKDAPAGGANNGGQDASAEGVCGCGREKSQGDDGGYAQLQLFHDNGDKEDA